MKKVCSAIDDLLLNGIVKLLFSCYFSCYAVMNENIKRSSIVSTRKQKLAPLELNSRLLSQKLVFFIIHKKQIKNNQDRYSRHVLMKNQISGIFQ